MNKSINLPSRIDIRITGHCNLDCPACFGPLHDTGNIDIEKIIRLIELFPTLGVKHIVLSGGEPLLVDGLLDIMKAAKRNRLKLVLSTNGMLLENKIRALAPFIDWIGLPLDGNSPEVNHKMRGGTKEHFNIVVRLLLLLKRMYPHINIKVGTVVTKINIDHITEILPILTGANKPDIWKLYQVFYCNYGLKNKAILEVSDSDFAKVVGNVVDLASRHSINMVAYYRSERDGKYLFLDPDGQAVVIIEKQEVRIGNFFDSLEDVASNWQKFINLSRMETHFYKTYPLTNKNGKNL